MQAITPSAITAAVAALADVERARGQARFFKTGPGQYGAGDQFIGVTVPQLRQLARGLRGAPLDTLEALLRRPVHEERLLALLILVEQYRRGDAATRQAIYELYRRSMTTINNWDLIDVSAADIVGAHLDQRGDRRAVLESLARSTSLWERRLAMISTYHQIKQGRSEDALHVAGLLLAPITFVHANMGFIGLKAFPAAVVGGFTSLPGAIVGGLIIGIVESLSGFYLPAGFKDTAPYVVVLIMLMVKPNGLFGEKLRKKV